MAPTNSYRQAWDQMIAPGGRFEVQEIDVRGNPTRVFASAPPHMRALWETASGRGDQTYLVYEDERYSYADIEEQVRRLAGLLREAHAVGRGDRVAVAMRNYPEWVVSYWATVSLGAALVGMNAWWTGAEMEYALLDTAPKVLIVDDERLERVLPHLDRARSAMPLHVISVRSDRTVPDEGSAWDQAMTEGSLPASLPPARIDPDDDACIFFTSGTTGNPKGAQLTHRGSVHNILHFSFMQAVMSASNPSASPPAGPTVVMAPTPLFHVTACNCLLHPATVAGGTVVLMYKWDPARALELIERERVTTFSGVPTMTRELLSHPDFSERDTSSLRGVGGGGAALQPDLVSKIAERTTGSPSTGYGLTETHGIVTSIASGRYLEHPDSCGWVVPTLEAKLVDEAGQDLPASSGRAGQLCVRGSVVIKGYLNRPVETAEAIRDGWFHTGDIARIDQDGFVYIVDRVKDIVIRGGENIFCSEVEASIHEHDEVAEVAVFGLPDDRLGERVAAAVVLQPGSTLQVSELVTFLSERIAKFKIPESIWLRTERLPRNANGKFVKRELRDEYGRSGRGGSR